MDIAHLGGGETVASLVQFIDGMPFKPNYRRFKIRDVRGVDDYASIREVIARRFQRLHDDSQMFPDLLLIDGGKGQLSAGLTAFSELGITPPTVISLAKREEEVFIMGTSEPLRLSPALLRAAAAAIRARRGASLCAALSPHLAAQIDVGRVTRTEKSVKPP